MHSSLLSLLQKYHLYKDTVSYKIELIIKSVLLIAMILILGANTWQNINNDLRRTENDLHVFANAISQNLQGALAFNDLKGLEDILQSLHANASIESAEVLDNKNQVLVRYKPELSETHDVNSWLTMLPVSLNMSITQPIVLNHQTLGLLSIKANLTDMWLNRIKLFMQMMAVLLVTLFIAILLAKHYTKVFITPLIHMAKTAKRITLSADYSLRVPKESDDEIGQLANEFNIMLETITQRDQALKESEFLWKFAIEGSGDGVWDWNAVTNKVAYSKKWKEMLGFSENEIGNGLDEWEKRINPADKLETMAKVIDYLEGRTPAYISEHRVLCKDGSYKWILDRGMVVSRDNDGNPLRLIGTHKDISVRKQSEDKLKEAEKNLRKIIEVSPTPLALNDSQGNVTYLNKAFTDTLGYTISDIPTLDTWWSHAYPDPNYRRWVADTWQKNLEKASKNGMPFSPVELNIQCKDNLFRTFIVGAASLDAGLSGAHLITLHDITERKQAELLLAKSEKQYRLIAEWEAHQRLEQSRFLAMLTHELKNPLATIHFATANLNRDKNADLNSLQHIDIAIRDIDAIIDHCVQADHVGSGHHQINASHFLIAQLVNEIAQGINATPRLQVEISNSLSIFSDKILFRIILINLIENALKYSPPDSEVSVSIVQKRSNTNQPGILISVRNRIGIAGRPDETQLFNKYYRSSSAQRQRGTGLGLWLVKGIAVQLGGQIEYISHPDKLEFQVWIPQL